VAPRLARWLLLVALAAAPVLAQSTEAPSPAPEPGFLGVSMGAFTVPGVEPPQALVQVNAVVPGSAAERAGIREGDLLLSVDGQPMTAPPAEVVAKFSQTIRGRPVGTTIRLVVRRRSLYAQAYLDEVALGPPVDGSGGDPLEALPDLGKLAGDHPDRLASVRARLSDRETEISAVLGPRPSMDPTPLPPNASLRPDLEVAPLEPAAALARRLVDRTTLDGTPARTTYEQLQACLEKDEQVRDAWRLNTVRYLKRDPLRLAGATRSLGADLAAVATGGPAALLDAARLLLDAPAPIASAALPLPTTLPEHARFLVGRLEAASALVDAALSKLTPEERTELGEVLPSIVGQFARGIYLHEDEDRARWRRHQAGLAILQKVDRALLLDALGALLPASSPAYLARLRADLQAAEAAGASQVPPGDVRGRILYAEVIGGRLVLFGGSEANEWRHDADVAVDLGGDDRYHVPVGSARPGRSAAIAIDLGGDDRWQATDRFAQGSAYLGAALLVEAAGDDVYTSNQDGAQGAAACGAALLLELGGNDVYRAGSLCQGAALCHGLGALVDVVGDDERIAACHAQGFGGPGAAGLLVDLAGDDREVATGVVPCTYGEPGIYHAMSQGASCGFRQLASGGVGVLLDRAGRDRYEAGNFSQGGGYYFGWGALLDLGPEADRYEGSRYSLGFGAHSGVGSFLDAGGNDRYRGWVGAQCSAAWDLSVTVFLDDAGDDIYETGPGFAVGAAAHNGFSLFVDRAGRDAYRVAPARAGPNDYHGGPSVAVFVDAGGGADVYAAGGLADDGQAVAPAVGIGVDLPGPLEGATDGVLDGLKR
jgi:hypothetical protein